MFTKCWRDLTAGISRLRAIKKLKWMEQQLPDPKTRFAVPFLFKGKGHFRRIRPTQTPAEIGALFALAVELQPRRVLEIGTANGGTLYLWTQAAAADAALVSVDLPGGQFGGGYVDSRTPFYQSFARPGQSLHLLRADSHASATAQQVCTIFGSQPIDFAFIDGDHTYEGVRADFLQYGPLVRPGGLIGFHDILPNPADPHIQVCKFWNQLQGKLQCTQFVFPDGQGRKLGIGVVRVGAQSIAPHMLDD